MLSNVVVAPCGVSKNCFTKDYIVRQHVVDSVKMACAGSSRCRKICSLDCFLMNMNYTENLQSRSPIVSVASPFPLVFILCICFVV